MSQIIEVKVPDIGDFHDVPVIELLVEPGATVQAEDPLLTLESDKAAIEQVAAASPEVARIGEGKTPKRIIVVPGRLVNVVL